MTDESLRRLARELDAKAPPRERVALARKLRRAGQADEAQRVLRPAVHDSDARREIVAFPAWTDPDGDPGGARYLDVGGMRRAPVVRWHVELWRVLERYDPFDSCEIVEASPLGIVLVGSRRPAPNGLNAFDADTGVLRWRRDAAAPAIRGEFVVVASRPPVSVVYDLVTGERMLGATAPERQAVEAPLLKEPIAGVYARTRDVIYEAEENAIVGHEGPDELWRFALPGEPDRARVRALAPALDRLFVLTGSSLVCLEVP